MEHKQWDGLSKARSREAEQQDTEKGQRCKDKPRGGRKHQGEGQRGKLGKLPVFPISTAEHPPLHWGLWMSDPIAGIVTGRTTNRQWQNAASSSGKREAKERCLTGCVRCRLGEAGCEAGAVHRLRIPSAGQP